MTPSDLFLCRTVARNGEDVEALSYFEPVCLGGFAFLTAEIDGFGAPLTAEEIAALAAWFETQHDAAVEVAIDRGCDDYLDRCDWVRMKEEV